MVNGVLTGEKIGQYEVRERIGQGAMGTVYRACDTSLQREVAIKVLSTIASPTPREVERFYREARAAAGLSHPNVVSVHQIGEHNGAYYFVMELCEGDSLRELVRSGKRMPWRKGLDVAVQVCRALEAAHGRDLLHRDIKPDNVWLLSDGLVKVLDFGIVRFSAAQTLTQEGDALGTPEYMSPEQILGEELDARCDVYAVGILMYELFTGHPPFTGPNPVTIIYKQMEEDPTPPGQLSGDLPIALERIILKAISKDRAERYPSAARMREEMEALLEGREAADVETGELPEERAKKTGIRFECRLVGREDELGLLKQAVDRLDSEAGGCVLIGGEAGIGKTRLAGEAMAYARRKGAMVFQGSCLYSDGPDPYAPFIQALEEALTAGDEDGQKRLLAFIRDEAPELRELTSRLMTAINTRLTGNPFESTETGVVSRERLFEAVSQTLLFLSGERPVVLLLDDLQWADSGTLQLLHYVLRYASERRLLILGTVRSEDLLPDREGEAHPVADALQRMNTEGLIQKVELSGLDHRGVSLMARFIFRRALFSSGFRASLYKETGGNPLFVLEVLRLLRDEGIIYERKGIWRERREITSEDIPDRVYDVVVRRIERLAENQRELLQLAAVAGESFGSTMLSSISGEERVPVLRKLDRMERKHQLLRSDGEAYTFSHPKIREILYEEISDELRQEYHLISGKYLEDQAGKGARIPVGDLARHFFHGGVPEKALPYLIRAGDQATRMFAFREALDLYRWASQSLTSRKQSPETIRLSASLQFRLGGVCKRLGEIEAALDYLTCAENLAQGVADHRLMGEAQLAKGQIHFRSGNYELATQQYQESANHFRLAGDLKSVCSVLVSAANIPFEQGKWSSVEAYYTRALEIARESRDRREIAKINMNLGIMASIRGNGERALKHYEKSRRTFEKLKDWQNLAKVSVNEGWFYAGRKDWPRAQQAYNDALSICKKTRNIASEAKCFLNLAEVMLETHDLKGSKRACLRALEIFDKMDNKLPTAEVYKTLGQVARIERKWEEARTYFEKSISIGESLRSPQSGGAHLEYSRMLKDMGDLKSAEEEAEHSVFWYEKMGAKEELKLAATLKREVQALQIASN